MTGHSPLPDPATFRTLARPGALVPIALPVAFDRDTAVTAYARLKAGPFGFLLESVQGGERWARFSFLGSEPREAWRLRGDRVERWTQDDGWTDGGRTEDPFGDVQAWVGRYQPAEVPGLPRFWGGAVGFFGYDAVRWIERLPNAPLSDLDVPDACFMLTDRLLAIDNLHSRALAVRAVPIPDGAGRGDIDALYEESLASLEAWIERLETPLSLDPMDLDPDGGVAVTSNRSRDDFETAVERIREYIRDGDAYQVVISQRLQAELLADPLDLYRALRMLNPSPYLFLLQLDGLDLVGSSPESLVRVDEGRISLRPIAGTRPRGATESEDRRLEAELLADEKERAEHLMLVDLGRNDVSRVARAGSVQVPEFMSVERYSHVMHLVSEVTGELRAEVSALEALQACFPAGTLSGAPKVRAMEIIDELEPTRRGPYGGSAGYLSYGGGSLDMAIVIRTLVCLGGRAYAQAGAGVVYDSDPRREWEETQHKARVLLRGLEIAGSPPASGRRDRD